MPAITAGEQELLKEKRVLVAGCGGLGGFLVEYLVRFGVGGITVADGDVFDESNLNRQLLSGTDTLGRPKAVVACERAARTDPAVKVIPVTEFVTEQNVRGLVQGMDIVLDALDSISARLMLEDVCAELGVTLVHGAVGGWMAQACVVPPGSGILHSLYGDVEQNSSNAAKSCLVTTAALCASLQAAEALKLLTGREPALAGRLLMADTLSMQTTVVEL